MKDVAARIGSWVRWHLYIGFERLYIFFDDASETDSVALARAAGGDAVVVWQRGEELRRKWSLQASWEKMAPHCDKDVQIRQLLNTQCAMGLAKADGIGWLLHLDSDEMWVPDTTATIASAEGSARAHFATLAAEECETYLCALRHEPAVARATLL